jgi:hypothetical protein
VCLAGPVCLERLQKIHEGGKESIGNRRFTRAPAQIGDVAEQYFDKRDLLGCKLLVIQRFGSVDFRRMGM